MRLAVVGPLVFHRRDQRRLRIVPARPPDPGARRHAGLPPVGADQQPRGHATPVRQHDLDPAGHGILAYDRGAGNMRHPALHGVQQRAVQVAILDHVADRAFLDLGAVEDHREPVRAFAGQPLGGHDLADRLRVGRKRPPQPQRRQQPARGERQRIGAAVEPVRGAVRRGAGVHHRDRQPRLRERQRQRRPVQPAARDDDVVIVIHVVSRAAGSAPSLPAAPAGVHAGRRPARPPPAPLPARRGGASLCASPEPARDSAWTGSDLRRPNRGGP